MQRSFLRLAVVFLASLAIPSSLKADNEEDCYNRGVEWYKKGKYDKAIAEFDQALKKKPRYADAYAARGAAWYRKGKYDKALGDQAQALRLNPNIVAAYNNRGLAWTAKGQYDKAIADFTQGLAINPALAINAEDASIFILHNNRGSAWKKKGDYAKAVADYSQALAINSNYADAYNNLAWLQATCPDEKYRDGQKAIENAAKACQLTEGKNWGYVSTLAAAWAESGNFWNARQWQEKAIALAPAEKGKQILHPRLELYKKNRPYHEEPKKT